MIECEEKGEIISKYAKDFKHFYSLWAAISLNIHKLPPVETFIKTYSDFMENVECFKDPSFIESYSNSAPDPNLHNSLE